MSEKYKFRNPKGIYFITPTLVGWVDLFTRSVYKDLVIDSIIHCQNSKGLVVHAWCIMSSHLHLIVSTEGESLSSIVRDFKKHTAKRILELINNLHESRKENLLMVFEKEAKNIKRNRKYKVWQDGNHPVELCDLKMMEDRLNYLHMNPVKAGIVIEPDHYLYSSAMDYCGASGYLKIVKL
jgi:putative transposase